MKKNWKIWVTILALAVMVFGTFGSGAWFSAQEKSVGNKFTAGTLDLTVGGNQGVQVVHITRTDLVPHDGWSHNYGGQFDLKNIGSVPGVLSITIQNVQNGTPTCNEPKISALADAGLPACVPGSATGGRLGSLMFGVWSRNAAPWGYLSSVYDPFNSIEGIAISPVTLAPGETLASYLDLEWASHPGTLDNTAQGDTLSFDIVFRLDQVHP
jgi:hypothetical protein